MLHCSLALFGGGHLGSGGKVHVNCILPLNMISRLRLAARLGGNGAQVLRHARPSIPATTRLMCQTPQKKEEEPEFGQFFRDVQSLVKAKTGETGPQLFLGGLAAYVLSKEILIINEETVLALVMGGTIVAMMKYVGHQVRDYLDDYSKNILDGFNDGHSKSIQSLELAIEDEKKVEEMLTCRKDIIEILRENNAMALELEYRNRLHEVTREVKKRLDYQVEVEAFQRRSEQQHIVDWVEREVIKSITPQQEKDSVNQCIKDLKAMSI